MTGPLHAFTVTEAADGIAAGRFSSEDLVRSCLARIAEREPLVRAWAHVDAACNYQANDHKSQWVLLISQIPEIIDD
ncbi:MAG: hypothetical protein NTV68_14885 [Methanomicrobiales archaeon]|nr:hypothetical protein [Methanomicrobiales archaeon]